MFVYEKRLQYPVKIANTNPRLASLIISQYGGPDGELGASLRYLSQRYSMPYPELKGLLTDIGTDASKRKHKVGTLANTDFWGTGFRQNRPTQQIEPHLNFSLPVNYRVILAVFQEYLIAAVAVDEGCHVLPDVLLQRGCLIKNALPRFHGV